MLPTFCGVILRHGSHILLLERGGNAKYWPLYWGFPGGKIEKDETPIAAAIRETQEEIGVSIDPKCVIREIRIHARYIDGDRVNHLFLVDLWEGTPENLEPKIHRSCKWFSLDELPYPIIPHIRAGLDAILDGEKSLEYDGMGTSSDISIF